MSARVLFTSYTADWRGPTNSLLRLVTRLRDRHRVGVLLTGEGRFRDELRRRDVPVHALPDLSKWSIPRTAATVARNEYDLVYANTTHGASRNAFLAATMAGRPFVCHVRAMGWDQPWSRLWYLRFADAVVAVSDACARSVARFVPEERLHRVYNGVPLDDSAPERPRGKGGAEDRLREEIGAGGDDTIALSVAHVCERKAQLESVRMISRVRSEAPSVHLCLAGATDREPGYTERVRRVAEREGVRDNVHLLGFRSDVGTLLADADLFVHTARRDPHPRAVVEAMAARLPVAAYRVDGVGETVVDGRTGFLAEWGDADALASAVLQLSRDAGLRRRMGDAARARAEEHFSADATADRVGDVIDRVIA